MEKKDKEKMNCDARPLRAKSFVVSYIMGANFEPVGKTHYETTQMDSHNH